MTFYRTYWDTIIDRPVEGSHPYCLPLLTCPVCNSSRGCPAVSYPDADVSKLGKTWESRLRSGRFQDFTWDEFREVRQSLRKLLPGMPLPPAAELGTFRPKVFKKPALTDFIMPNFTVLLAKSAVVEKLRDRGHNLHTAEIQKKPGVEGYVEIWAPPIGKLHPDSGSRWCDECERFSPATHDIIEMPDPAEREAVFCLPASYVFIVFSPELVRDIASFNLTGLSFELLVAK